FARVAVAPDLGALLAGWRNLPAGWSAVTVEGDLADGRGLVALRGRADPPGGNAARQVARRRRIAEELTILEPAYARAADAAAAAVASAAAAERRRAEAQRLADAADAEARRVASGADAADRALERAAGEETLLTQSLTELALPIADAEESAEADRDETGSAEGTDREVRVTRARENREAVATARKESRDAWQLARSRADELERGMVGARRREATVLARRESLEQAARDA